MLRSIVLSDYKTYSDITTKTKTYSDIKTYVDFKLKNESIGALVIPNVMLLQSIPD
jgi:hypothetical protein